MWRPQTPAVPPARLIEELQTRASELREAAKTANAEAAESIRQWADDLESEVHALVIGSWGAP